MWLRYRLWNVDGLPTHTKQLGLAQLVFEDASEGVLDVRHKAQIEALLRDPSGRYELAYEAYGAQFDAAGVEVRPPPIPCEPSVPAMPPPPKAVRPPKLRGRPPKRR